MSNFEQFSQREWLVRPLYGAGQRRWMDASHQPGASRHQAGKHPAHGQPFRGVSSAGGADASALPLRPHRLPDSEPLVKLTDFGLSRFIDPSNPLLETRCGSEEYAAPELIIGKKYDGRKTDAWALGVVLYALITGSLPFMEDVSVGANGAREGQGEERDPKQRKRHLLRIAKGDLRWPSPANDACEDQPDPAKCPASMRLVTPMAKAMVGRLLRRDATKRATPWETWDEPWLLCGSFGYASLSSPQTGRAHFPRNRSQAKPLRRARRSHCTRPALATGSELARGQRRRPPASTRHDCTVATRRLILLLLPRPAWKPRHCIPTTSPLLHPMCTCMYSNLIYVVFRGSVPVVLAAHQVAPTAVLKAHAKSIYCATFCVNDISQLVQWLV